MTRPGPVKDAQTESPGSARMVAVMGAVGLIASVLLVATYQITTPYIAANRAAYLEQAIFEVLPGASTRVTFAREDDRLVVAGDEAALDFRVFAGYDEAGTLVGVAIEAQGQGFQDVLRLIYGYVPSCDCVVGMKVLESKETPGLGDKIETDAAFQANFNRLDVRLNNDATGLQHPVVPVKPGTKTDPWQVATITGATISSKAVARIIDESAGEVLPLLHENLNVLREGKGEEARGKRGLE